MAVLAAGLGWPLLAFPLGLDQGIYAVNAARLWEGHALYAGAWDMKSPGIFAMYAIPVGLGGFRVWPIQVFHVLLHTVTAVGIYRLVLWGFSVAEAWTALVVYLALALGWGDPITNGQPDDWMLPFVVWGVHLLLSAWVQTGRARRWCAYAAGLMIGWSVVMRSPMALSAILLPLALIPLIVSTLRAPLHGPQAASLAGAATRSLWRPLGLLLGCYVAGGATMAALTVLYFVLTGSLHEMLYSQVTWVAHYAQTMTRWDDISPGFLWGMFSFEWQKHFNDSDWRAVTYAIPAGVIGLALRRALRLPTPWWFLGTWAACLGLAGLPILVQMKFFNYHFWPIFPLLAISLALGLHAVALVVRVAWRRAGALAGWPQVVAQAGTVTLALWLLYQAYEEPLGLREVRKRFKQTAAYLDGDESAARYLQRFHFHHIYRPIEDHDIVAYIRSRVPEGEVPRLYIWGFRPKIYFSLGTTGPSRFAYNLPLRAEWSPKEWQAELHADVMREPPDFLIVGTTDHFAWVTGNHRRSSEVMPPWLAEELQRDFRLALKTKHLETYERISRFPEPLADLPQSLP